MQVYFTSTQFSSVQIYAYQQEPPDRALTAQRACPARTFPPGKEKLAFNITIKSNRINPGSLNKRSHFSLINIQIQFALHLPLIVIDR